VTRAHLARVSAAGRRRAQRRRHGLPRRHERRLERVRAQYGVDVARELPRHDLLDVPAGDEQHVRVDLCVDTTVTQRTAAVRNATCK
jgi:hypothetical protein